MIVGENNHKYYRDSRSLNAFLADVRRIPMISPDDAQEIAEKAVSGDESAMDRLIEGNLRFIYSIAKIYSRNEDEVLDYVNEGVLGLKKAIEKFDPEKGYKFITYGVWYIRRQMNYYMLTKRDTVLHSAPVLQISKKIETIKQRHYVETGRVISDDEIREILKDSFDIKLNDDMSLYTISTAYIDDDVTEDYSLEDTSGFNEATASVNDYENEIEEEHNVHMLSKCLSKLSKTDKDIVMMKYGIGDYSGLNITNTEIGEKYNIDPERIDLICETAFEKIRGELGEKKAV